MGGELGQLCLILLLLLSALQAALGIHTARREDTASLPLLRRMSYGVWLLASLALAVLWHAFLTDDFTLQSVALHSHLAKPWYYKWSASWGHHEGSLLLWLWVLGLYGAAFARGSRRFDAPLAAYTLAVQGGVTCLIGLFVALTSSPFTRLWPKPEDGGGLNPLLQDAGLAVHPPMLYLGYVGFSLCFSLAAAMLAHPNLPDAAWRELRRWALFAWGFLTFGITLGAWWAHRELGWGGWWFWDPVENASLLPWLGGTALIHLLVASDKSRLWRNFSLLLALLSFVLSLLGTFLVRSGLLTSVHSFANDPTRGLAILAIIGLIGGYGLYHFARHAGRLPPGEPAAALSRETGLYLNALLFSAALAILLLGVGYPLVTQMIWTSGVSIGPAYYAQTLLPLTCAGLALMLWLPDMTWRKGSFALWRKQQGRACLLAGIAALAATAALGWLYIRTDGLWLLFPGLWLVCLMLPRLRNPLLRPQIGTILSHAGFGFLLAGIVGSGWWQQEREAILRPNEHLKIAPYDIHYRKGSSGQRQDYFYALAQLEVVQDDDFITNLLPEKRIYPIQKQETSEADRAYHGLTELHAVISDVNQQGDISLRFYLTPLMPLVWLGGLLLGMGGICSAIRMGRAADTNLLLNS